MTTNGFSLFFFVPEGGRCPLVPRGLQFCGLVGYLYGAQHLAHAASFVKGLLNLTIVRIIIGIIAAPAMECIRQYTVVPLRK